MSKVGLLLRTLLSAALIAPLMSCGGSTSGNASNRSAGTVTAPARNRDPRQDKACLLTRDQAAAAMGMPVKHLAFSFAGTKTPDTRGYVCNYYNVTKEALRRIFSAPPGKRSNTLRAIAVLYFCGPHSATAFTSKGIGFRSIPESRDLNGDHMSVAAPVGGMGCWIDVTLGQGAWPRPPGEIVEPLLQDVLHSWRDTVNYSG